MANEKSSINCKNIIGVQKADQHEQRFMQLATGEDALVRRSLFLVLAKSFDDLYYYIQTGDKKVIAASLCVSESADEYIADMKGLVALLEQARDRLNGCLSRRRH